MVVTVLGVWQIDLAPFIYTPWHGDLGYPPAHHKDSCVGHKDSTQLSCRQQPELPHHQAGDHNLVPLYGRNSTVINVAIMTEMRRKEVTEEASLMRG